MSMERFAESVRRLISATSSTSGTEFFRGFARSVAELLDVRYALVGALDLATRTVKVLALWDGHGFAPPVTYGLEGTPCEGVFGGGVCHYPAGVQQRFPADHMLAELGVESYWGAPVRDRQGRTVGLVVALDVRARLPDPAIEPVLELLADRVATELERDAFERAIAGSEARYRQIVNCCQEGVWTIDLEARTTLVNEQMAAMLGYTPAEMLGRPLWDFMDARAEVTARANMARRERGVAERHEFRLRHRDGRDVWTTMAASPLVDDAGITVGALALVADLTQQRELEDKVLHGQKLESLGVLAGGIAHDFNNLLVGVLGNAGLAMRRLPAGAPALEALRDIEIAALRAADLTRQLLAYSGKGRFVVERIALNAVVEEMAALLRAAISKKAVLRLELDRALPGIEGDGTQLRQVIMNLITNASDALGDEAGVITVRTHVVDVDRAFLRTTYLGDGVAPGRYVCLEVSDTGVGMTPATLARIFDPFFTTKASGRGLGLAALLGILRGHHGTIAVVSAPGQGATFQVLLPRALADEAAAIAPPEPRPAAVIAGTVLVADDEAAIRSIARQVLELEGYAVLTAVDGLDAVQVFTERAAGIDAVLLDLSMPNLSGAQALEAIRRIRPDVRVVLSSGYSEIDIAHRIAGDPCTVFLRKPWTPDELLALIAPSR
ncbi:MAG: PAS domain S-box protein [Deltaproteobacteria bacterium]|nr:PAS domain S-box protein [Deltaproteobacteria bacterium]